MLTISEVAGRLRISERTVNRLLSQRKLAATKVGNQWRISEDQLEDYLESRTIKARKIKIAI